MVVTLHKSGDTFSFTLPPQAEKELALIDGSSVEIKSATRYVTASEAVASFDRTLPNHEKAYRELAK